MTLRILLVAVLFLGGVIADEATARSKRVRQVPNGSAASCNTCHTAGGGSPLNPFGLEIVTNFLTAAGPAGDVIWGPELADLDSDGDGASNGAELGDPEGTWMVGDPDPTGDDDGEEDDHGEEEDPEEEEDHTHGEEDDHGEEEDPEEEEDHTEHDHEGDSSLAGKVFNPGDPTSTPPPAPHDDTAVEVSTWAQIKHLIGALDKAD
ncbi:MAG: hypothetical protein F4Z30_16610 [Gemmatimonadetes bacterium]|nr:hypothetical protein [Gemmatimonadota bacterium]